MTYILLQVHDSLTWLYSKFMVQYLMEKRDLGTLLQKGRDAHGITGLLVFLSLNELQAALIIMEPESEVS